MFSLSSERRGRGILGVESLLIVLAPFLCLTFLEKNPENKVRE